MLDPIPSSLPWGLDRRKRPTVAAAERSLEGWPRRLLTALAYPGVVTSAFLLHLGLLRLGVALLPSSYAAVALGALLVGLLERHLPYRQDWRPKASDVRTDALFMVLVQGILPFVLALTVGVGVRGLLEGQGLLPVALWPHDWPVWAQVVVMLLLADFFRYWLHVASHRWQPLWRLHAVHHSSQKLYWLNVGRFHPLEKGLQYLLDSLPFVLLGVDERVLAAYLVFYATNGFFQHSNVDVRLGPLNTLISGPELHRWHHSRTIEESCSNYGNNLIVWDLLFGTRFLPSSRQVGELGLDNSHYPESFGAQLRAPLVAGVESHPELVPGFGSLALHALMRVHLGIVGRLTWWRLVQAARRPGATQRGVLERILRAQRHTPFGRRYGFDAITSYEAYRRRVPLQTDVSLRLSQESGAGAEDLLRDRVIVYARTSGTTGKPKLIPWTRRALRRLRRHQTLSTYVQARDLPVAYRGRLLGIVGPAVEGWHEDGTPIGSASGHLYRNLPRLARRRFIVPAAVFDVEDYDTRYRLILRLAVAHGDVTAIGSANPSTFLKLVETLDDYRPTLLADLERGTFTGFETLPAVVRRSLRGRLRCSKARLEELRRILRQPRTRLADLWPHLALVNTWTGGSSSLALERLRHELPGATQVVELGYLASELRGTLTVDLESRSGLPTLESSFFEFVVREDWEDERPRFLTLEELEEGREYYVFVTTMNGLYRYCINDIVRARGRFENTPMIEFVQKGRGVTNLTGEKLSEAQVVEALRTVGDDLSLAPRFFLALASQARSAYRLLLEVSNDRAQALSTEDVASAIDDALCCLNVEYQAKQASGRLGPLEIVWLRDGAGEAYKRQCLEAGQREAQFKTVGVQYEEAVTFDFRCWRVEKPLESALRE